RLIGGGSAASVQTVRLDVSQSRLRNDPNPQAVLEAAIRDRLAGTAYANAAVVVVVEGAAGFGCGWEGTTAVVIPIENCGTTPTSDSVWPGGMSYLVAHELTHLLGAVEACAPHHVNGHVDDDPRDILYEGPAERVWDDLR